MVLVVGVKFLGGHPLIRAECAAWLQDPEDLSVHLFKLRSRGTLSVSALLFGVIWCPDDGLRRRGDGNSCGSMCAADSRHGFLDDLDTVWQVSSKH